MKDQYALIPPPFDSEHVTADPSIAREYDPERIENLDGAGEVQCRPGIQFGNFDSGRLRVKVSFT